ncbi:hypothetical protein K1719_005198 [Acacia pycnantha]|nr:hypothetical protein K1719_005198 [Acacia pycnantha]
MNIEHETAERSTSLSSGFGPFVRVKGRSGYWVLRFGPIVLLIGILAAVVEMKKLDGERVDGRRGSEKEMEMVVDYGDKDGSRR